LRRFKICTQKTKSHFAVVFVSNGASDLTTLRRDNPRVRNEPERTDFEYTRLIRRLSRKPVDNAYT